MSKRIITSNLGDEFNDAKRDTQQSQKESLADLKRAQERKVRRFKSASCFGGNAMGPDIVGLAPEYFVPQLENSSLELPRYRQEIVSWCDYYYQTNPLVGAAIDIHASLSISDFAVSCKDKKRQQEYEDMLDDLDYTQLLEDIAHEYFRLGNVFPMGDFDEDNLSWREFVLIPMLNVDIKKSILNKDPKIFLVPDETLKQMSLLNDPMLRQEFDMLPPDVREKITQNIPILIDPTRITHISTRSIAGTQWGPPPMFRCFKTLVYNDKLFRSQEVIADRQITPLKIISLITPDGFPVTPEEEENFRDQLIEADYDPNFYVITSGTVKDNYIGSTGKVLPLNSEMDMVERNISTGMRINKALMHGEGPTYANAQVYQSTMSFYYQSFRNKIKRWLLRKVFKPVAEARGWYDVKETERFTLSDYERSKRLILPEIYFRGTGLMDTQTIAIIDRLNQVKKISDDTFIRLVAPDIDPEEEKVKILRQESEKVVLEKVSPGLADRVDTPTPEDATDAATEDAYDQEYGIEEGTPTPDMNQGGNTNPKTF